MNFIFFNGQLLFSGIVAIIIFSIGLMVSIAPLYILSKIKKLPTIVTYPFIALIAIYQVYFWGLWSAYCVVQTIKFTQLSEVTWDWLYWIFCFMWCIALISWFSNKETQCSQSCEEIGEIQKGSSFYTVIATVAFFIFTFAPSFILLPYGWFFKTIGMQNYIISEMSIKQVNAYSEPILVKCDQPLPNFTLGENTNVDKEDIQKLCTCVWNTLTIKEREMSKSFVKDPGQEYTYQEKKNFAASMGNALRECGALKL